MQASEILMIEPVHFAFNHETAVNNTFQKNITGGVQEKALKEFTDFASLLRKNGISVTVIKDTAAPHTPDAIFPNNWISFHEDNSLFLYPMFAVNRRLERKEHVMKMIREKFKISTVHDLSYYEHADIFLEGTGSMVLDRVNKIAYAAISPRTNLAILLEFCHICNYAPVSFYSTGSAGHAIYHSNVMMCMADAYVVICLDTIRSQDDRQKLFQLFQKTKKEIIEISFEQLEHFAGNMLQLQNGAGELLLLMSTQAFQSLSQVQVALLEKYNRILHSPLNTIEACGGGSARCMIAEIFNDRL